MCAASDRKKEGISFSVCSQKELLSDDKFADEMIDIIVDNLSYLFGDDMGSDENREEWKKHNLKTADQTWHTVFGRRKGKIAGFIIYTIKNRELMVNDFEISKDHRLDPALMIGLLKTMIWIEYDSFDKIRGYINKNNTESQANFLRYATDIIETEHGYRFIIDKEKTFAIKKRFKRIISKI